MGNRYADFYAQEAVKLHPEQRAHFWRDANEEFEKREKILRTIGAILALWPSYEKELDAPEVDSGSEGDDEDGVGGAAEAEAAPPPETPHQMRLMGLRWTCMVCLRHVQSESMARKIEEREECALSFGPVFRHIFRGLGVPELRGHRIVVTGTTKGHPMLVCMKCGGWAMASPQMLDAKCRGKEVTATRTRALERMRQGLHPADHAPYTNLGLDGVPVPWEDMIRQSQAIVGDTVDLLAEPAPPEKQDKPKRVGRPRRKQTLPAPKVAGAPGDGAVGDDEAAPETVRQRLARLRADRAAAS